MGEQQSQLDANAALLNVVVTLVGYQRYAILVSTTILIYDHVLTLDDEVTYIWRSPRFLLNPGSILFLLVRYLTPFGLIFSSFSLFPVWNVSACEDYYGSNFAVIITCTVLTFAVWLMILRTYALYDRSLTVLFFLLLLWGVMLALMIVGYESGHQLDLPDWVISLTRLCLVGRSVEPVSSIYFVGMLIVDTTTFVMTLYKLRRIRRCQRTIVESTGSELIDLLFRDGIMYYVVVCLTHCFNFLFMLLGEDSYRTLGASFSQSFSTMLVCRLMLRLQKTAYMHRTLTQDLYCTHTSSTTGAFTSHLVQFFEEGLNECPQCRLEAENRTVKYAVTGNSPPAEENAESRLDYYPNPAGHDEIQLTSQVSGPYTVSAAV